MNALAADQARRIAQTIDRTPALRGKVTAGVFVGRDNQPQPSAHKTMGRDHVVTDRDTLRERPPDILLTNYKMLDYLLVRPFDFRLWRHNRPDTLDGAQGTDLACLIRRLRVRLGASRDTRICAGTSATLGEEADEAELRAYVSPSSTSPSSRGQSSARSVGHRRLSRRRGHQPPPACGRRSGGPRGTHAACDGRGVHSRAARALLRRAHRGRLRVRRMAAGPRRPPARALDVREPAARARRPSDADVGHRWSAAPQSAGGQRPRGARGDERSVRPDLGSAPPRGDRGGGGLRPFLQVGLHLWVRELRRMVCSLYEDATEGSVEELPDRRDSPTNAGEPPAGSRGDAPATAAQHAAGGGGATAPRPAQPRRPRSAGPTARFPAGCASPTT